MDKCSVVYKTPIGPLKLEATDEGICAVKWLFGKHSADLEQKSATGACELAHPVKEVKREARHETVAISHSTKCTGSEADEHLQVCQSWLDAYFNGTLLQSNPQKPNLILPESGTDFFHIVWNTLTSTGVGETLSYKELAKLSGKPNAARAVGRAVKSHCLPILVPCHRVVKSGRGPKGTVETGNYSGGEGPSTKEWLLQHEKKMLQEESK